MLWYTMPCHAMLWYAMIWYSVPFYTILCYVIPCHAIPCNSMLCYALLCYVTQYNDLPCYAILDHTATCYAYYNLGIFFCFNYLYSFCIRSSSVKVGVILGLTFSTTNAMYILKLQDGLHYHQKIHNMSAVLRNYTASKGGPWNYFPCRFLWHFRYLEYRMHCSWWNSVYIFTIKRWPCRNHTILFRLPSRKS